MATTNPAWPWVPVPASTAPSSAPASPSCALGLVVPFVVADPTTSRTETVSGAPTTTYDFSAGGDTPVTTAPPIDPADPSVPIDPSAPTAPGSDTDTGAGGTPVGGAGQIGGPTDPAAPATTTAPSAAEPRRASDVGITEDTIKLGILVPRSELAGIDVSEYNRRHPGTVALLRRRGERHRRRRRPHDRSGDRRLRRPLPGRHAGGMRCLDRGRRGVRRRQCRRLLRRPGPVHHRTARDAARSSRAPRSAISTPAPRAASSPPVWRRNACS